MLVNGLCLYTCSNCDDGNIWHEKFCYLTNLLNFLILALFMLPNFYLYVIVVQS